MSEFHLAVQVHFTEEPEGSDDDFDAFTECVHEALEALKAPVNVAARLRDRMIDVAGIYEAPTREAAKQRILTDVRTALHSTECSTAGWPTYTPRRETVEELQDA